MPADLASEDELSLANGALRGVPYWRPEPSDARSATRVARPGKPRLVTNRPRINEADAARGNFGGPEPIRNACIRHQLPRVQLQSHLAVPANSPVRDRRD